MKTKTNGLKDGMELISVWQTNEGDLVCYTTSQKVYIIAEKREKHILMVSATQQFRAMYNFNVIRLLKASDVNEKNYSKLIGETLKSEKNISLKELLKISEEYRQTLATDKKAIVNADKEGVTPTLEKVECKYPLLPLWNADSWFDKIVGKEFRTEKEVETKFILPLLARLGYDEDDRFDAMPINAASGSRKTTLEIDFAMFVSDVERIKHQVVLVVEAKKEFLLSKQPELERAQMQTKSYSIWSGCRFGLITDSRTIQVLDLMPNMGGFKVLFQCHRSDLKERFLELYNVIGKKRLGEYYTKLIS